VRTALGILGYSLAVLKLFDPKFYRSMPNLPLFFSSFSLPLIALHHTSRPTICRPRCPLIRLRFPPCAPFAARLCRQERHRRYYSYLCDTHGWTGSQASVRAAIRDCRTHRGSRCLHCCRDGDSPPSSSSHDMNPRSCIDIVTLGSLKTKCTPYAIIYNLYLNHKLLQHRTLRSQLRIPTQSMIVWMPREAHS
jgi:hypothetical protein